MVTNEENNIAGFSERIRVIESKIDELSSRINHLDGNTGFVVDAGQNEPTSAMAITESNDGFSDWVSKGALLQKMAIICFILVFALLLRTVTDYGYINSVAGSLLGLAYVSILAVIGCVFYVTGKQMANVFSISGFLLLFTIVLEGYGRFGTIPIGVAYAILLMALLTSTFVGIKYRVPKLLSVSLIGVTISCIAVGFPRVHFPLSGLLLFVANWTSIIASDRLNNSKLKWPVTMLTILFVAIWVFKAYIPISRGDIVPDHIYISWFCQFY